MSCDNISLKLEHQSMPLLGALVGLMKSCFKNCWLVSLLAFCCGLLNPLSAQTFVSLYSFSGIPCQPCFANQDGSDVYAGLVVSDKTLYGATYNAGPLGFGTVFSVRADGTQFTVLHSFSGMADGGRAYAGLALSSNTLYGTASDEHYGYGNVYSVHVDGSGFSVLHYFTNGDGANPYAGLVLSGTTLYGTTAGGTASGTVFAVNIDGTDFRTIYTFTGGSDGGTPFSGLVLSNQTLYGMTFRGGISNCGTVYAVGTDGNAFRTLHVFTNSDGANPTATLALSEGRLYGTTHFGGSLGYGTVFAVNIDGTGFLTLHNFSGTGPDCGRPTAGLVLAGKTLYGAAYADIGLPASGTVFTLNTDGTGFTTLHSFSGGDGAYPFGAVVLSDQVLYGTTQYGGATGNGTVFSLSLPVNSPQLTITSSAQNVILTWPTNDASFVLQSATNLSGVWTGNLPPPLIVNGQYTVTNPISGTQQFFRLGQ